MRRLNDLYGRLLDGQAAVAGLLLFVMMASICTDVISRGLGMRGIGWSGEVSEYILYLSTFMAAPWLLRLGRHVRLDLVLRGLPLRVGYSIEWLTDLIGLGVSVTMAVAGLRVMLASRSNGNLIIKTLEFPEWYILIPVPITFALLALEFVFRMYRLWAAPIGLRQDITTAA
jgi:TRAP-type transport system small permease protein